MLYNTYPSQTYQARIQPTFYAVFVQHYPIVPNFGEHSNGNPRGPLPLYSGAFCGQVLSQKSCRFACPGILPSLQLKCIHCPFRGKFGQVFRLSHKDTGRVCAGKFYKARGSKNKAAARREIELMNHLHHPKLVQCLGAYDCRSQIVMVME